MKAVAKGWPPGVAAPLAAKAGCDLLLACASHDAQVEALEGLVRARERDEISWDAMDQARERVRRLKQRFLLPYVEPDPRLARRSAGPRDHQALAREVGEKGGMPA
jgi:beta-glucosidase-like glycosyl hydrolase